MNNGRRTMEKEKPKKMKKVKKKKKIPLKIKIIFAVILFIIVATSCFGVYRLTRSREDKGGITAMEGLAMAREVLDDIAPNAVLAGTTISMELYNTGKARSWGYTFQEENISFHTIIVYEHGDHLIESHECHKGEMIFNYSIDFDSGCINGRHKCNNPMRYEFQNWTIDSDEIVKIIKEKKKDFFSNNEYKSITSMSLNDGRKNRTEWNVNFYHVGLISRSSLTVFIDAGNGEIDHSWDDSKFGLPTVLPGI
jgi:hypothetical protein